MMYVETHGVRDGGWVAATFRCDGCDSVEDYLFDVAGFQAT